MLWETPTNLVHERKFDTALRIGVCNEYARAMRSGKPKDWQDKMLNEAARLEFGTDYLDRLQVRQNCFPGMLARMLQPRYFKSKANWLKRAERLAMKNIELQLSYMMSQVEPPLRANIKTAEMRGSDLPHPPELIQLSLFLPQLDELVTSLGASNVRYGDIPESQKISQHKARCKFRIPELDCVILWNNRVAIIKSEDVWYLVPRSYLLMIHNKTFDVFSVLSLVHKMNDTVLEASAYVTTVAFIKVLISLARKHNQEFFHISKILEGLVTSMTLMQVDGRDNHEFYTSLLNGLLDDHKINLDGSELLLLLEDASIALRHELGCLSKILGHPYVDMEAGAKKLYTNVTQEKDLDSHLILETLLHCKRQFIKSYLVRHHKWPLINFSKELHPGLVYARLHNRDPESLFITSRYGNIDIKEYNNIDFYPCLTFDFIDNIIPLLKDKTISVLRSKVMSCYLNENPDKVTWKDTRVLLHYLLSRELETNHRHYIEKYMMSDDLEDLLDYLVIRIVPKEKELKEVFRGFGCKTFLDRARGIVQERNVKHYLDLYSNEQAMTLSELDILHRLNSFRFIHKAYPGYTPLFLVIDASGWNNMFRRQTVDPVMRELLDKLYGTSIFGKTMLAYNRSLIYIPDQEGTWHWEGQEGGIEGLNQDTWVTVYIGQIHTALSKYLYPYHVFCKGDDLRVVVMVPPHALQAMTILEVKNAIVTEIQTTLQKLGHSINVQESYGSTSYFAFSKSASCGTIELPQSFRKIQKAYGANNAFLPLLDDYIGSAFSNAHSATKTTTTVVPCYYVALIWSYYHLLRSQWYQNLSDHQLVAILLVPSMMGGFPIIYLHNFFVRAESDLLSPFLGMYKHLMKVDPEVASSVEGFLKVTVIPPEDAFRGLLADPYSLPLRKPTSPNTVLRTAILPAVKELAKNETVKTVFKLQEAGVTDYVVEKLQKANVYNAKVFAAMYAASPDGILTELSRKFETARSILELLILRQGYRHGRDVLRNVLQADRRLHRYRCRSIQHKNSYTLDLTSIISRHICPLVCSQSLRDLLWERHVESITMPPLQHQLYVMEEQSDWIGDWSDSHHFTYTIHPITTYLDNYHLLTYAVSGCRPFIGYTTRNAMVPPRIHFVEKDLVLTKVKDLIDLIPWTHYTGLDYLGVERTSNLVDSIRYLLSMYLDVDPDQVVAFRASKRSGTISHHVRAPNFRESIVPNTLSNIYQQFTADSNSHTALRSQGIHMHMNFLHIMCYSINLLSLSIQLGTKDLIRPTTYWVVTTPCEACNQPIVESPIVTPLLTDPPDTEGLRVTSITDSALQIVNQSIRATKRQLHHERTGGEYLTEEYAIQGVVQEFIYTTYTKRMYLLDCHAHAGVTVEGYSILQGLSQVGHSRNVGITEMARVDKSCLSTAICFAIYDYVMEEYTKDPTMQLEQMLLGIKAADLPWFFLVEQLRQAGRLHHVVNDLHEKTHIPVPANASNSFGAAPFLGLAAAELVSSWSRRLPPYVHLSIYELDNLRVHLLPRLRILRQIIRRLIHGLELPVPSSATGEIRQQLLECADLCLLHAVQAGDLPVTEESSYGVYNWTPFSVDNYYSIQDSLESLEEDHLMAPLITDNNKETVFWFGMDQMATLSHLFNLHQSTLELSIVYTDLESCIALVRSLERDAIWDAPPPRGQEYDLAPYRLTFQNVPIRRLPHPTPGDTLGHPAMEPPEDFPMTRSLMVRTSFTARPFAIGSTGFNKLRELLHHVHITVLPSDQYYMCLAEGDGGFAGCIGSMCTHSTIIYNTLHDTSSGDLLPTDVSVFIGRKGNVLDTTLVNCGYSDLSSDRVVARYCDISVKVVLTTCDINPVENFELICENALTIYLQTRTVNGAFVVKGFFRYWDFCLRMCRALMHSCAHVILFKPESSHASDEFYFIGLGSPPTYQGIPGVRLYPGLRASRVLMHFYTALVQRMDRLITTRPRVYVCPEPNVPPVPSQVVYPWTSLMVSRMTRRLMWGMSNEQFLRLWSTSWEDGVSSVVNRLNRDEQNLRTRLYKRQHEEVDSVSWNTNTRRRKTSTAELLLFIDGCRWILNGRPLVFPIVLDEVSLRREYNTRVERLPPRLKWYPVTPGHYTNTLTDNGFVSEPYRHFLDGVETGLSLFGWYQCTHNM